MTAPSPEPFWSINAGQVLAFFVATGILLLAYVFVRGARNYLHIQLQFTSIVLVSGALAVIVFLSALGKISEDALVGILGSMVGYVLGSTKPTPKDGEDKK